MNLADELSQRGMTQTYLAERLGVHPSQVNRWCRGAGMSIESEGRIRSVLGIPEPECQLDERHTRMLALLEDRPLLLELLEDGASPKVRILSEP